MPLIELTEQETQNLLHVLTQSTGAPWAMTHPLIMKIGGQTQGQQAAATQRTKGNSHGSDIDEERGAAAGPGSVGSTGRNPAAAA